MIKKVTTTISKLEQMTNYPKELFAIGNLELLKKPSVSIVGSRRPNQYAQQYTHQIANRLSNAGICIVSGGAIGVDTISHIGAGSNNTIMIAGTGLDKRYPAINRKLIEDIENSGLVLSQFEAGVPSNRWNFPIRNEIIVALSDILIVPYADINSGSSRSIKYALDMGKSIYVLPHRIGDSDGTNRLLQDGKAKAIFNIDEFIAQFGNNKRDNINDKFLEFCKTNPTYTEAINKDKIKVFEYELNGKIKIKDGIVSLV
jgi:DNA processing protein